MRDLTSDDLIGGVSLIVLAISAWLIVGALPEWMQ